LDHRSLRVSGSATLVAVLLALQVVVAAIVFGADRPAPYGWQMYSAIPYVPRAWADVEGSREAIDVEEMFVHARAEIDRVGLLRSAGCDWTGADALRIELEGGAIEEVACP
jgi:hypothetical protein